MPLPTLFLNLPRTALPQIFPVPILFRALPARGCAPSGDGPSGPPSRSSSGQGIRLLAPLFAADDLRRAAVFTALAAWYDPGSEYRHLLSDVTAPEFAQWLLTEDPEEIARILDGSADEPLTRLSRLGGQPLAAAEHYRSSMLFGARTLSAGEAEGALPETSPWQAKMQEPGIRPDFPPDPA